MKPCPYCNRLMLVGDDPKRFPTRDHVFPARSRLPTHLVIVCASCNEDKGAKHIDRWLLKLRGGNDPRAVHVDRFIANLPENAKQLLLYVQHTRNEHAKRTGICP